LDGTRITDSAGLDGLAPKLLARIAADLDGSDSPVGISLEIEGLTVTGPANNYGWACDNRSPVSAP
jgi:hypothetical protein